MDENIFFNRLSQAFLDYLLTQNILSSRNIQKCLEYQKEQERPLSEILVKGGYFNPESLQNALNEFQQFQVLQESGSAFITKTKDTLMAISNEIEISKNFKAFLKQAEKSAQEMEIDESKSEGTRTLQSHLTHFSVKADTIKIPRGKLREEEQERYKILETLGEGGMGLVQRAQDQILGREVALKRIKIKKHNFNNLSRSQKLLLWRLQQEASITAILEHPNIIPLYDMQKLPSGDIYFTMRRIEGDTLHHILNQMTKGENDYTHDKILSIFLKICDAISYAHNQGIIHRDLKPSNIMVGPFGEVYVMDWGISKHLNSTEKEELLPPINSGNNNSTDWKTRGGIGTVGYMSPEQAKNSEHVSTQTDIYSLGKILKQCFTFLSPAQEFKLVLKFYEETTQANTENSNANELLYNRLPKDIQAIVKKATAERLSTRYQTIQEMANDVDRYLRNVRVSVRDYSFFEMFHKWFLRNKQLTLFIFLFIIIGISSFFYLQWENEKTKELEFQRLVKKAKTQYQKSTAIAIQGKQDKGLKINLLLETLNSLNAALLIKSGDPEIEKDKLWVGEHLITLCCETKDYNLASYVASDLQNLKLSNPIKKYLLKDKVQTERKKTLTQNLNRLAYWMKTLKVSLEPGFKEQAILEISKMQEEEVLNQLVQLLQEGVQYFIKNETRTFLLDSYYGTFALALGSLENPKAGVPLLTALDQMAKKMGQVNPEKRITDFQFMVPFGVALGESKASHLKESFYHLRKSLGEGQFFWRATETAYQKLLRKDKLKSFASKTNKDFLQNGKEEFYLANYLVAIQNFNQYLKISPQDAEAYHYLGKAHHKLGHYNDAIENYNKAVELSPDEAALYNNRGNSKLANRYFVESIEDYNKAISLNPNFVNAFNNRGVAKFLQQDYQSAIEDYNRALAQSPSFAAAYCNRGNAKKEQGKIFAAVQDYDRSLEIEPLNFKAYSFRGTAKYLQKDYQSAIEDFTRSIEINPSYPETFNNRGTAKKEKGDLNGAIQDFNQAILLNNKFDQKSIVEAYFNRGATYFLKNQFTQAIQDYSKAIEYNPQFTQAYQSRAKSYYKKKEYQKAWDDCQKAIEIDPSQFETFITQGMIKESQKDFEGAKTEYEKALQVNPKATDAYYNLGNIKVMQQKYKEAIEYYSQVIEITPKDHYSYLNRGTAKYKFKDFAAALLDYQQAIQLKSDFAPAYYYQGLVYEELKKTKKAMQCYNKALSLNPKFARAYYDRGFLKQANQNIEGAINDYSLAIKYAPKNFRSYLVRGKAREIQKNYDKAIEDYTKTIQLNSNCFDAYNSRGAVKLLQKKFEEALNNFNKAILLTPNNSQAYNNRGVVLTHQGKLKESINDFKKALALNPMDGFAFNNMGFSFQLLNQNNRAILCYEKGLQLQYNLGFSENIATLLIQRMNTNYQRKKFDLVYEDALRFQKLAPKNHPKHRQVKEFLEKYKKENQTRQKK